MPRGTRDCFRGRRLIACEDFRLSRGRRTCDLTSKMDDQSLRGQALVALSSHFRLLCHESRLPTGLPFRCYDVLESAAYEEGFPVISRLYRWNYFHGGQFNYPTRNFATLGSYPPRRREDWTISSSQGRDVRRMASEDSREHLVEWP